MKKNIKNLYQSFISVIVLAMLIAPNLVFAFQPETRDATSIEKDRAYLNGYYVINSGGIGNNGGEFINFAYSKLFDTSCTHLATSQDAKKTSLQEVKSTKSSYSASLTGLSAETNYYFCIVLYKSSYFSGGGTKFYEPIAYGQVLNFKTHKGLVAGSTQTQTSGITPRTVAPNLIGNVSTYEASRTTDTEALFSGDVDRLGGEAYAYFRYATLDKPPVFCNDIYGSAQRNATATNPNAYGRIGVLGTEAEIRKSIETLKNQTKPLWLKVMNSQPYSITKIAGDSKAKTPNLNGYYTRYDAGGIINVIVDKSTLGNKFPDFTYSGLVSGKGNVGTPTQLGNTGLELDFFSFTYQGGTEWQIVIPNTSSPEYQKNLSIYNQNLQDIKDKEAELANFLSGVGKGAKFSTVVRDLSPNTVYYYCAIVSNNAVNPTEIEYGPVKTFRTLPCQTCPQSYIKTTRVVNISSNTATFYGEYGSVPQLDVYFEYRKEGDLAWKQTAKQQPPTKVWGDFWNPVSGLSKSTVYQFRAVGEATTFAKTGGGAPTSKIYYGETLSFKTNSGNLFDAFGWTEDPLDNPTDDNGDNGLGNPDYPFTDDGSCSDGIKNGDETGVDRGGRCGKVGPNPENPGPDCEPNCGDVIPPLPTCYDGIQNGNETGIDTGGWCGNGTPGNGNCFDGIKNGDETDIDIGGRCDVNNPGGSGYNPNNTNVISITGGGSISNSGGTTISSGGTTVISGGTTTTNGGTTTISGGTTNINGQNTSINNGIATNTGGTATTTGGTTTLRGGTTTITYKDANGNTQTFITNSEVTISRNGASNVVTFKDANGNTQTITIRDGEGQITNVGGVRTTENGNTTLRGGRTNVLDNRTGPKLGDKLTPPNDAIVRYHEGIETVFTRQIMHNLAFARLYGYQDGTDLQTFADTLSHTFAKEYFGYINADGLEVRVSKPDVSAYELRQVGGVLTVYEYYENVIVDIRNTTTIFKNKNPYEYYDRRRR